MFVKHKHGWKSHMRVPSGHNLNYLQMKYLKKEVVLFFVFATMICLNGIGQVSTKKINEPGKKNIFIDEQLIQFVLTKDTVC